MSYHPIEEVLGCVIQSPERGGPRHDWTLHHDDEGPPARFCLRCHIVQYAFIDAARAIAWYPVGVRAWDVGNGEPPI